MKKVLILAYDFYPYNSIGAQRPYSWYKYFHQNNLYPVVITRHWDNEIKKPIDTIRPTQKTYKTEKTEIGETIYAPFKPNLRDKIILKYGLRKFTFFRKLLTLILNILKYPFNIDSTKTIYNAADQFLENNECSMIIATGEPFILFKYASFLSKKHHIPWVADYRDGWTTNQSKLNLGLLEKINLKYQSFFERNYIDSVSIITTASPSYQKDLQKMFPKKRTEVIYNGYFKELIDEVKNTPYDTSENKTFKISYSGTIYKHQQIEVFLDGFKKFIAPLKNCNIEINFIGLNFFPDQKKRILDFDHSINKYFNFTDRVPLKASLEFLNNSDVLLLLSKKNANWLNAKIFDYIALEKKILFVENDLGVLEQILDDCETGVKCNNAKDVENGLKQLYYERVLTEKSKAKNSKKEKYSRCYQTKKLVDLIQSI